MNGYDEATQAFEQREFRRAEQLFSRIATDLPEVWLPVIRCREELKDVEGVAAATKALRSAAEAGGREAAFAYHLLTRDTGASSATPEEVAESRAFLRKAASAGYPPAVEQLRADIEAGRG